MSSPGNRIAHEYSLAAMVLHAGLEEEQAKPAPSAREALKRTREYIRSCAQQGLNLTREICISRTPGHPSNYGLERRALNRPPSAA